MFRSTEGGFSIHPHDIKQPSTVDAPSSVSSRSSKADWKSNRLTKRGERFVSVDNKWTCENSCNCSLMLLFPLKFKLVRYGLRSQQLL